LMVTDSVFSFRHQAAAHKPTQSMNRFLDLRLQLHPQKNSKPWGVVNCIKPQIFVPPPQYKKPNMHQTTQKMLFLVVQFGVQNNATPRFLKGKRHSKQGRRKKYLPVDEPGGPIFWLDNALPPTLVQTPPQSPRGPWWGWDKQEGGGPVVSVAWEGHSSRGAAGPPPVGPIPSNPPPPHPGARRAALRRGVFSCDNADSPGDGPALFGALHAAFGPGHAQVHVNETRQPPPPPKSHRQGIRTTTRARRGKGIRRKGLAFFRPVALPSPPPSSRRCGIGSGHVGALPGLGGSGGGGWALPPYPGAPPPEETGEAPGGGGGSSGGIHLHNNKT